MQHHLSLLPLLILSFTLPSCRQAPPPGLVTIDIDEAMNNKGELRLSEIATDVEFIPLHGMGTDTYIHSWSWQYFVGVKVICVFNLKPYEFLLFTRDGKFIRKIGTAGKGPGEFIGEMLVFSVDEASETILLADNSSKKFLLYRFSGEFIREQAYKKYHGLAISFAVGISPDKQGNFVIKNQIVPTENDICYDILIIDRDLKLVQAIQAQKPVTGPNIIAFSFNQIYPFGHGIRFWNPEKDTVYQLINNQALPVYHLKVSDPPSIEEEMTSDRRGHITIGKILETRDYLLVFGNKGPLPFHLAYRKPTGKAVRIFASGNCGLSFGDKSGIENDLFGYSPVTFSDFACISNGKLMLILHPGMIDVIGEWLKGKLTDCLRSARVLLPDKRDELVRLIENPDENSEPILMAITLK
jgi:hypothetical protein